MLIALLALLGLALALLGAMGFAALWHRRRVRRTPGIFGCKIRVVSGDVEGFTRNFPRAPTYAIWVRDVLLVYSGPALRSVRPLPLTVMARELTPLDSGEAPHLALHAQVLRVRADSGAVIEIVASMRDAPPLMAPVSYASSLSRTRRDSRRLTETVRLMKRSQRDHERKGQELRR